MALNWEVVVCTSEGEDISGLTEVNIDDVRLLKRYVPRYSMRIPEKSPNRNKFNQIYSTLKGAEVLLNRGCTHIVKLRTDQTIDLNSYDEFLKSSIATHQNLIFQPFIDPLRPNQFEDMTFCGTSTSILAFCNLVLTSKELHFNTHYDFFYRWALHSQNLKLTPRLLTSVFPMLPNRLTKVQQAFIRDAWQVAFFPMPSEIWASLSWRGFPFGKLEKLLIFENCGYASYISKEYASSSRANLKHFDYLSLLTLLTSSRVENFFRRSLTKSSILFRLLYKKLFRL